MNRQNIFELNNQERSTIVKDIAQKLLMMQSPNDKDLENFFEEYGLTLLTFKDLSELTTLCNINNVQNLKLSGICSEIKEGIDSGSTTYILQLDSPIERVKSSLYHYIDGSRTKLKLEDVVSVKIKKSNFTTDFVYNAENRKFSYAGDELKLDISDIMECWLIKETFAEQKRKELNAEKQKLNEIRRNKFRP